MGRKRKNESVTRLDEADRTLYTAFRGAANALSQLYTQSMTQQKLSFQAGERHAMVSPLSLFLFYFSLEFCRCFVLN
jgi:hypothetical protein